MSDTVAEVEHKVSEIEVDTRNYDHNLLKNTAPYVKAIDSSHTIDKATVHAQVPISKTPELDQVGATRVGAEDSDVGANIEQALKIARSSLTGESVWARIGKAIRGVNILNRKKAQMAKMKPGDFKSDLDIGE